MNNEVKELMNDFLKSIYEYLEKTNSQLDLLVDGFYKGCDKSTWDTFNDLLEGLDSISKMFNLLLQYKQYYPNINEFINLEKIFSNTIKNLGFALENGDRIYIIDIIIYELKQIFPEISKEIARVLEENINNAKK